jgi:hypothetical protein
LPPEIIYRKSLHQYWEASFGIGHHEYGFYVADPNEVNVRAKMLIHLLESKTI